MFITCIRGLTHCDSFVHSFVVVQEELLNGMYFVNEPDVRGTHTGDALGRFAENIKDMADPDK